MIVAVIPNLDKRGSSETVEKMAEFFKELPQALLTVHPLSGECGTRTRAWQSNPIYRAIYLMLPYTKLPNKSEVFL